MSGPLRLALLGHGFIGQLHERAALAWAELLTRLPDGHAGHEAAFEVLREHFSEQEIVELTWTIAQINTWNRLCVGMHAPVPDKPLV